MKVLGIETSCDETAAAVVEDGRQMLSNVVASSLDLHIPYGGVVPEIAARSHIESIIPVIDKALIDAFGNGRSRKDEKKSFPRSSFFASQSDNFWSKIDAIAVTQGPGLLGSLLVGVLTARTLAIAKNKPLYAVNHIEAHVYAAFLENQKPRFPLLALIVSGGHTQLVLFEKHFKYIVLGQTLDDAVGEAFDKVAKILGLPYPGGPSVAKFAKYGNPDAVNLPAAKTAQKYDFSFSGIKTAVLRAAQSQSGHDYTFPSAKLQNVLSKSQKANLAASFQKTVVEMLISRLKVAEAEFKPQSIVIAGGVAANQELRQRASEQLSTNVIYPSIRLCTDNAAMIAALGYHQTKKKHNADPYSLEPDPGLTMTSRL
jgi:N6-L-threonylcarbamoyladenine synthase